MSPAVRLYSTQSIILAAHDLIPQPVEQITVRYQIS